MLPPSFDQDVIHGYMSEAKLKQESESNCMKSQEVRCKMKHEVQEAPVYQVFTFLAEIFFCYHDACLPGFHQWHFFVFQFFCIFNFFNFFRIFRIFQFFRIFFYFSNFFKEFLRFFWNFKILDLLEITSSQEGLPWFCSNV